MGWEVMRKEYHTGTENEVVKFCFFCNTSDMAFGPVFYLDCTEDEFYTAWREVNPRIEPRDARGTHLLGEAIEKMQKHFGMVM